MLQSDFNVANRLAMSHTAHARSLRGAARLGDANIDRVRAKTRTPARGRAPAAEQATLSARAAGQRFLGFFAFLGLVRGSISDPALATDEVAWSVRMTGAA